MAPLTTWLPACPNRDFDLIIKIVSFAATGLLKDWTPIAQSLIQQGFSVMVQERRFHFVGVHGINPISRSKLSVEEPICSRSRPVPSAAMMRRTSQSGT